MKLPILVYHKVDRIPPDARYPRNYVTPEQFDAQLALLRARGYTGIGFGDYLAYRRNGAHLPRRPIILTFDDGYKSNRTVALPRLARHGFRATVFAVAGLVGGTNVWDADERQEALLDADDLRALQAAQVEIGSHTLTHARLPELSRAAAFAELRGSRERLEAILGRPVRVLAYPYGVHSEETRRLAADGGFEAAVIVRRRMNTETTDLYALRRISVGCDTTLRRFAWDLFRLRWFYGS
jgi:peptidoglycan/xylan/chitin deacetylase (PgdA/CDA1 family)